MENKLKNINYIRYINILFTTLSIFSSYNYADTKMTTCCCGSCREGGNQENNSISNNTPDLLQKSKFNLLNKKKDNKNTLKNINEKENQNFLSNNITLDHTIKENSISYVPKENIVSEIPNLNEINNLSKIENTNETINSNQNNKNFLENTVQNFSITNNENNTINTENNNKSCNNSKENSSIQANNCIKTEDISKIIECNKDLIVFNKDLINNKKKIMEKKRNIMEQQEELIKIQLLKEKKLENEQSLINDLNTYIKNGYGLGEKHTNLTPIYNDYKSENNSVGKNEDTPTELIKNLIKFFNKKKEKVENLMNTLQSSKRFINEFYILNEKINNTLKSDHGDNYDNIFKDNSKTYKDYLILIDELEKINVINTKDKNKIYNYFSKLEICYQAVKKELETINQEIIEINYEKNTKANGNNFENFLIREGITIKGDVCMFEILKNSKICLKINNNIKNCDLNIKVEGNKQYFLVLKKSNYIKFNIVKCEKGNKYYEVINLKQQVKNYDKYLKEIELRPQSDIIKLKCIIKKNPTEPKKKEENTKINTTHTRITSFNTNPNNNLFRRGKNEINFPSPSIAKNNTNKICLTNKKNNKFEFIEKKTNNFDRKDKKDNKMDPKMEKIIKPEDSKKKTRKIDSTKKINNINNINNIKKEKANIVQKIIKTNKIVNVKKKENKKNNNHQESISNKKK